MDLGDEEEFASFRKHILPCTSKEAVLSCGSFHEQPFEYAMLNPTDLDYLSFDRTIIAVKEPAVIPKDFHGEILTLETDNCHVGFAHLMCHRKGKIEYFVRSRKRLHGPAVSYPPWLDADDMFSLASKFKTNLNVFTEITADHVYSVLCPHWPPEADEWITRKRFNGWPTKDMIDRIVSGGCHVVPKAHQSNPSDDTIWRFSFSQAELILVTSWNEIQKYVYHILRLLKADVIKKCGGKEKTFLCTYSFKTLMLWACEEKPSAFWSEDKVEAIVVELLLQMIEWLIKKNCPNYFIRENNMIDYLPSDTDTNNEVSMLLDATQEISSVIAFQPKVHPGKILHLRISEKLLLFVQLAINRRAFINPMDEKFQMYSVEDLSNNALLVREVEQLFRALQKHRLLVSDMSSSEVHISDTRNTLTNEALTNFQSSHNGKWSYTDIDVYISLLDSHPLTLGNFFHGTSNENSQRMRCSYQEVEVNSARDIIERLCQSVLSTVDKNHRDPSYFISAAYYANFHYTCLRDYRQALKICDDALAFFGTRANEFSLDKLDHRISAEVFCVFLNREYIHIYDAGIQAVFGFLTLCMNSVKQNEKRTSYQRSAFPDLVVQVSPVGFLAYIGNRCRNVLHLSDSGYSDIVKFFQHMYLDYVTGFGMQSTAVLSAATCVKNICPDMKPSSLCAAAS